MNHNKYFILGLALIILGESISTGLMPIARGYLFTLLSAKSGPIWTAIFLYFITYLCVDFFQSIKGYVVLKTTLWYRSIRTATINAVLPDKEVLPSNTPQRIQEDIKLSYLSRISVWIEYIISGIILIQLFFINRAEPILIGFALGYAILSVLIAIRFNPRLTKAEINVQQAEASYRTCLVANILDITSLNMTNKVCLLSKWLQTEYLLFTKLQLGLMAVLPYIVLIPKLLNGNMQLGQIVEAQASFALIALNASVLIQLFPMLVQGRASEKRVQEIVEV